MSSSFSVNFNSIISGKLDSHINDITIKNSGADDYGQTGSDNETEIIDFSSETSDSGDSLSTSSVSTSISSLTEEELLSLIGQMSVEEYNSFIEGVTDYYDDEAIYLQGLYDDYKEILERVNSYIDEYGVFIDTNTTSCDSEVARIVSDYIYYGEVSALFNAESVSETGVSYDDFINMTYDEQVDFLKLYDEELQGIYSSTQENLIEWNETIQNDFSDLGITSYEELTELQEQLTYLTEAIDTELTTLQNNKQSAYYDYLYYLDDYNNYEVSEITDEDLEKLQEDSNAYDASSALFIIAGVNQTGMVYSYTQYHEKHPDVSPLQYIKMVQAQNPSGSYTINGLSNYDDLVAIIEVSDSMPNLEKIYDYLYSQSEDKAEQFLSDCKYEINNIRGQLMANEFLSSLGELDGESDALDAVANELGVSLEGLIDGLDSFGSGVCYTIESLGTLLGICEENRVTSANEYKKMYILQALLSESQKEAAGLIVKDEETGEYVNADSSSLIDYTITYCGGFLSNNYEISQGIGNMLPSIIISATVCPLAGSIAQGVSAGGNSYHSAMVEGHSFSSALAYGIFNGSIEALTEKYLGGLPGLSDVQVTSLSTWLKAVVKEGNEEMVQGVMDAVYQAAFMGEALPATTEEWEEFGADILKQGVYGAITAGILQSPSLVSVAASSALSSSSSSILTSTESSSVSSSTSMSEVDTSIAQTSSSSISESDISAVSENVSIIPNIEEATLSMPTVQFDDYRGTLSMERFIYELNDGIGKILGDSAVEKILASFNIVDSFEKWSEICADNGIDSQTTLGFVTEDKQLYVRDTSSMHTLVHESFHLASQLDNLYTKDSNGNVKKVTGIREFYSNGLNSIVADEALTDFLASISDDGLIYNSLYNEENVELWARVNECMTNVFGDETILMKSYLTHDTNLLRSFFNEYCSVGNYDEFATMMNTANSNLYKLTEMVLSIEKNVSPSILNRITSKITEFLNQSMEMDSIDNGVIEKIDTGDVSNIVADIDATSNFVNGISDVQLFSIKDIFKKSSQVSNSDKSSNSKSVLDSNTIKNLNNVVLIMDEKYDKGAGIDGLLRFYNGQTEAITRDNNCRNYVGSLSKDTLEAYFYYTNSMVSSITEFFNRIENPISNYSNLNSIIRAYFESKYDGKSLYSKIVSIRSSESGITKKAPFSNQVNSFFNRFSQDRYSRSGYQYNAFYHVKSDKVDVINTKHRLYINADYDVSYDFLTQFADKCESRGLEFYFKTAPFNIEVSKSAFTRDESIVIYSTESNLVDYVNICQEIKYENPNMKFYSPPICTGVFDNWLGYGGESYSHMSFNTIRSNLISVALDEVSEKFNIKNIYDINNLYQNNQLYNQFLNESLRAIQKHSGAFYVNIKNFAIQDY